MRDEIFGLAQGATAVSSPGLRRRLSAWLMALSVVRWGGPAALSLRGKGRALSRATAPFRPGRVAVLSKTTRFEFEQERGRAEGERRRELRERLATKGSSYNGLLERHTVHSANVQHVVDTLHKEGIEVRLVKRRDYTEEIVQWADAIVSAGGLRGTCASQSGTRTVFQRLCRSSARESSASCDVVNSDPQLLSVRALNEVFVGESLSSRLPYHSHKQSLKFSLHRASYCEISIDDGPWEKHKNSGLNMCTGTGSRAWSYNINKLAYQEVEDLLSIAKEKSRVDLPINQELVEQDHSQNTPQPPCKESNPSSSSLPSILDQEEPMDVIYLDFKKALDKVLLRRLLSKIRAHGVRGKVIEWIEAWLSGRKLRVEMKRSFSGWQLVTSGVLQGSVLDHNFPLSTLMM
ncbi:NAD kinase 2, mitochondrial isoform X5 [Chiloscyllium plagiosum]|uniref:NAD kinase 2, mitochondrial isoform X5 n=1 Tax=Chiloscyllium plagiosum TaxID=36176 RepID=UPI001CB7FE22|nr:NAD kinase 2, mitochondrial isoform X5 [Chiloscyllium plagiosum]